MADAVQARIVLTTAGSAEEARKLGRILVEEHLAACATLVPQAESIYRWYGQVETAAETLVLLKTETGKLDALEQRLKTLHSYEVPEFLVLAVETGSVSYLNWLHASLTEV